MRALRLPEVKAKTGLGRSHIYDGMAAGWFPKCFKLVPDGKAVAWAEHEIDEFLEQRAAERNGKAG